jgi:ribonuclease P protein component|tara:strand:- start:2558 stop:2890 length:333 start_codon:yes stop_codon:yes gene_type:complete
MKQLPFKRKHRMTRKKEFEAMYSDATKHTSGPLLIHKKNNGLPHSRLGLSVPKRVGNAIKRNQLKRMCREAFRSLQPNFPENVDILITVRPHDPMNLSEYVALISKGITK